MRNACPQVVGQSKVQLSCCISLLSGLPVGIESLGEIFHGSPRAGAFAPGRPCIPVGSLCHIFRNAQTELIRMSEKELCGCIALIRSTAKPANGLGKIARKMCLPVRSCSQGQSICRSM